MINPLMPGDTKWDDFSPDILLVRVEYEKLKGKYKS